MFGDILGKKRLSRLSKQGVKKIKKRHFTEQVSPSLWSNSFFLFHFFFMQNRQGKTVWRYFR